MENKRKKRRLLARLVLSLICFVMIAAGIRAIMTGDLTYKNYWGGVVFGPFAIIVGFVFLYVIIFRWGNLDRPMTDKKGRKMRFPGDDFRKW